jgi:hypothetical protein
MTVGIAKLRRRVKLLERRFLPPRRPLGDYTNGEQDFIRALIVLSHAEIEAYLEGLAEFLWEALFNELTLLSPAKPFIAHHADSVFNNTQKKIKANHGLKAENIRELLEPFGIRSIDLELIDPSFLSKCSTFGTFRGTVAHGASEQQIGLKKALDSARLSNQLADLIALLEGLDKLADQRVRVGMLAF